MLKSCLATWCHVWRGLGAGFRAAGLVVAGWIQCEVAQQFAVDGDDADVAVGDEDQYAGVVVRPAGADVVQAAVVAQGDTSVVDDVAAHPVVGCCQVVGGRGAGSGVPGLGWGRPVQRAVRPVGVVDVGEGVELGLLVVQCLCGVAGGQPAVEGLVEAFDFAAGLGVVGTRVDQADAEGGQVAFERDLTAAARLGGEDGAVVCEDGGGQSPAGERVVEDVDDVGGFVDRQRVAGDGQAAVVVDDVEDLDGGAVGEVPVGGVGLPALVGLVGFEADQRRLRAFLRLGGDEPAAGQDPPDRRGGGCGAVAPVQVRGDGRGAGIQPVVEQLFA